MGLEKQNIRMGLPRQVWDGVKSLRGEGKCSYSLEVEILRRVTIPGPVPKPMSVRSADHVGRQASLLYEVCLFVMKYGRLMTLGKALLLLLLL